MSFRIFNPPQLHNPSVGYSHVAEINSGKLLLLSGQVALDSSGTFVGKDDFAAQTLQVFENLNTALHAAGATFHNVVKLNIYCAASVQSADLPAMRTIRDRFVNTANPPCSTLVFVVRLARPEWLIEIEALAVVQ